jgi:hypothetical protein
MLHIKCTINNKYKLNFKTMKKGLLTVLAASLVFVGCQNYDDQFDDLNAQISALKSQVDGLSSLSGQVASLSGTISGLQAGVNAAQASASAAAAAAAAIETTPATDVSSLATAAELSALSASLAALDTAVAAVQASLAGTATAASVTTLQAEIDAIEADLDDLLSTSNIYSTNVSVTDATSLNAALALGNKLNVLNASLTVTGWAAMSYTDVQTLIDRIQTMTGNITYTAGGSTGTEVVFNNLTSVGNVTMTQPGGYHFPKLTNAAIIRLNDDYETTVTRVNFPLLTTVTGLQTDATADSMEFTYATSMDFGSLKVTPDADMDWILKKDGVLDIGSFHAVDAAGTARDAYDIVITGAASWTNGTAAGTFASTGLPGNTVGMHDGTMTLTNVASVTIHNYRGGTTLSTGVKTFTGKNIVTLTHSAATDLETVDITWMRDNNPSLTAAQTADLGEENSSTAQDLSFTSSHTKLTSVTATGSGGDVTANAAPALTTVNLTGLAAFDVNMTGNAALTSFTDATSANDWTFTNNDLMTSVNASHTTTMTTGSGSTDKAGTVTVTGNAEITTLTIGFDDVDALNITSNAKLATIAGGAALKDNNTATTTDVDIHQNALVASLVRDTKEAPSATVVAGATSDTGSITTTSGIKDLDGFLTDAVAASGTVSVWFDTVSKLEIQATYGGSYTDTTASMTAPTSWTDGNAATNAALRTSGTYAGNYAYVFSKDAVSAVTSTTGARANEVRTHVFNTGRAAGTYADLGLAANEGIVIKYDGGTLTFKQGDTYNGSTVATIDELVAYMNADTALDQVGIDVIADRSAWEQTLLTLNYTQSTGAAAAAGTVSGADNKRVMYSTSSAENSTVLHIIDADVDNNNTVSDLRAGLSAALNAHAEFNASNGTNSNQILMNRTVSAGTVADRSPVAKNIDVNPVIDATMVSTTAFLLGNDQYTYSGSANVAQNVVSNTAATASSLFAYTVTETALSGIRVTLKNTGNLAFSTSVSLYGAAVSNTGIITTTGAPKGDHSWLRGGVNAPAYAANTDMHAYETSFTQVTAGTTTTTTSNTK